MNVVNFKGNVRNRVVRLGRTVSQTMSHVPDYSDQLETKVDRLTTDTAMMRSWYNW
ncbi:MAG: hypothetical protein HXS49_05750 [Theionarchaea archaeon]|nr:hypothetical protein [Theionarchaea archaeon]MBU7034675.1 hypothetical protein [Theionarchaea archaeon]